MNTNGHNIIVWGLEKNTALKPYMRILLTILLWQICRKLFWYFNYSLTVANANMSKWVLIFPQWLQTISPGNERKGTLGVVLGILMVLEKASRSFIDVIFTRAKNLVNDIQSLSHAPHDNISTNISKFANGLAKSPNDVQFQSNGPTTYRTYVRRSLSLAYPWLNFGYPSAVVRTYVHTLFGYESKINKDW